MRWNWLSILKLQRYGRWCLGMERQFHPVVYWLLLAGITISPCYQKGNPACLFALIPSFGILYSTYNHLTPWCNFFYCQQGYSTGEFQDFLLITTTTHHHRHRYRHCHQHHHHHIIIMINIIIIIATIKLIVWLKLVKIRPHSLHQLAYDDVVHI